MFQFGSGVMTVTPDSADPTPVNIGLLQEGSFDMQQTVKELFGQYKDPVALGSGTRKWAGKAKVARFSGSVMNALLFGGVLAPGMLTTAYEAMAVPAAAPYTANAANAAGWKQDQGVIYAATGLPLQYVAANPQAGQYSVAAGGIYTFAAADAGKPLVAAYNYTVATGRSIVVPQSLIGPTLRFANNFTGVDPTTNKMFTGQFYSCVAEKFRFGTKLEDFAVPEFDFKMSTNGAGSIGQFNFPDTF